MPHYSSPKRISRTDYTLIIYLRRAGGTVINSENIGDNYEESVIFLVTGYQYISSAMAYNFGYEHRAGWFRNWRFAIISIGLSIIQFYIALVPSNLSCLFRVNCDNINVVTQVIQGPAPIANSYATTVMPVEFRWVIAGIMMANLVGSMTYEYFFVNGILKRIILKARNKDSPDNETLYVDTSAAVEKPTSN